MRSRAARFTATLLACLAIAAAGIFLVTTERTLAERRTHVRSFELRAREAARQLAEARAGQQAYIAAGQSPTFWMPKVGSLAQEASRTVDELRGLAVNADVRRSLLDVSSSITEFLNIDKRAREFLQSNERLMAADMVFSDGAQTVTDAAKQIEAASQAEREGFDAFERDRRRAGMMALAGAAGVAVIVLALLAIMGPAARETSGAAAVNLDAMPGQTVREITEPKTSTTPADTAAAVALRAAADLCGELSRVTDLNQLQSLVGHAADAMDAAGLIVWLGSPTGIDLHPIVTHGYPEQAVRLLGPVSRHADNAAAEAYRSARLQVVPARPGEFGAVVAPLVSPDGCIGALTAEIRNGGEEFAAVQSLAAIVAAQLSTVLAASATENAGRATQRIASA